MTIASFNPATEALIQTYPAHSADEVEMQLKQAQETWQIWKRTSLAERSEKMRALAILMRERKEQLALLMTMEVGKPITAARAEIEKSAWVCDYYAENAESMLKPVPVEAGGRKSYVTYNPLGAILAIMPWNFPFWQVFRFAAPALMAGN